MKKQTKLGLVLAAAAVISVSVASLVSARGWVQQGADWYYVDNDGEYVTDTIQSSGNAKFYLGEDGAMMKDYFLEEYSGAGSGTYYFGSNGAMVTNTWVAIESSRVENQQDYVPDNYWYYFQASGKAMKAASGSTDGKKTTIDGKKYLFNEYGQMLTGWIYEGKTVNPDDNENPFEDAIYYAGGDNDGVLRTGWVTYYDGYSGDTEYLSDKTNLYFYFNTSNCKKVPNDGGTTGTTKKINGKTYGFNSMGIMISGWDQVNEEVIESLSGKTVYFSGQDDGHQVKKGWVYDVPASSIDQGAYDDGEEKYMYFNNSGDAVTDQIKKINGKYYIFNRKGIMKTGLAVWCPDSTTASDDGNTYKFVATFDLDYADGGDLQKKGIIRYDKNDVDWFQINPLGYVYNKNSQENVNEGDKVVFHYFGADGARKTGTNTVEFTDDVYTFVSKNTGNKETGVSSKKYYSMGILLKASADLKYGIYNQVISSESWLPTPTPKGTTGAFTPQGPAVTTDLYAAPYYAKLADADGVGDYLVLNTSGAKLKANKTAKKDADGNYWLIHQSTGNLLGIYTVNTKWQSQKFETNSFSYNTMTSWLASPAADDVVVRANGVIVASTSSIEGFFNDTNAPKLLDSNINTNLYNWSDWILKKNSSDNTYYFQTEYQHGSYWYQGDFRGSSNKWIPFGVYDDARNTCVLQYEFSDGTITGNERCTAYNVTPTNDYFLNCYWAADPRLVY